MTQYIYTMNQVSKLVPPKREILKNISLSFYAGAKIGVLGLNGAGKSTLLRIMAGIDKDINGEARVQSGITIGYLEQEPILDESKDVRGNVEEGVAHVKSLLAEFDKISNQFADPMTDKEMDALLRRQSVIQDAIDASRGWEIDRTLDIASDALRLPEWDSPVTHLSGGERRRVALCRILVSSPDMLLLDEPTNHLDAQSVAWLERFLQEYSGTVIAITHDRYFLDNAADWILELDRGHGIPWKGNYTSWLEQKETRLSVEEKTAAARARSIKSELNWVRSNPQARRSKSKARLAQFEQLVSQERQSRSETQEIYIPAGSRLGDIVVEANHVTKSFGDKLLFSDLNFCLPRGGIAGVIGANGSGKSTLLKMIAGVDGPDSGKLIVGETVELAYIEQSRSQLDGTNTVWQEVSNGNEQIVVGKYQISSRAYIGRFNFKGSDQEKRVCDLSGGERNRLHLAKLLRQGANLLLLDEPTNDLDVETMRALEEALLSFAGSAIVVSHDRWFLDRIATHILALENNSAAVWFAGNFTEYEEDRMRRFGKMAAQPSRTKYKSLTGL